MQRWRFGALVLVLLGSVLLGSVTTGQAGIGDKLKKKVTKEAQKTTEKAVDKATGAEGAVEGQDQESPAGEAGEAASGDGGDIASVSTKFDYVPGDSVILFDDFTQDELGEFPANWKLRTGTLEVAEMKGQRWLRCTSTDSDFGMKLPDMQALPEYWTLEFDAFCPRPSGNVFTVFGMAGDTEVWDAVFPYSGNALAFRSGEVFSSAPLEDGEIWGRVHHIMFMARGNAIKAYVDRQRLANVPEIDAKPGLPTRIAFRLWSTEGPMIANVRFAEGNKPVPDPMASGKLVTHGIYFDTGSDVVQPESAPVLRQIAAYLEKNPNVRLMITGHTDNVGTAVANLDLSKRRAASVAKALSDQLKVGTERLSTDGKGDTEPIASNTKAEGRAMNRRVEFTKL